MNLFFSFFQFFFFFSRGLCNDGEVGQRFQATGHRHHRPYILPEKWIIYLELTHGCVNAGLEIDGAQGDASETRAGAFGEGFKDQKKRKKRDTTKNWLITTGLGRNSLQEIKKKMRRKATGPELGRL